VQLGSVPAIQELVCAFEAQHPELSVSLLWLLLKTENGDGFSKCHFDYKSCSLSATIVVNLATL